MGRRRRTDSRRYSQKFTGESYHALVIKVSDSLRRDRAEYGLPKNYREFREMPLREIVGEMGLTGGDPIMAHSKPDLVLVYKTSPTETRWFVTVVGVTPSFRTGDVVDATRRMAGFKRYFTEFPEVAEVKGYVAHPQADRRIFIGPPMAETLKQVSRELRPPDD